MGGVETKSKRYEACYQLTLLTTSDSAFAHKRDVASGNDLAIGQAVSFVLEDGPKGASAKRIREDVGAELMLEDDGDRLHGKVKVSLKVFLRGTSC